MVMTKDQARRLRVATGIRLIKKMTPEEINQTFERQFNEIEELQAENAKLQQELKYSDEDLIAIQKSLSKLETEFESISLMFCDSEGDPNFEPFNAENLSIWLKEFGVKQRVKGVEDLKALLNGADWEDSELQMYLYHHIEDMKLKQVSELKGNNCE